MKKTALVIGLSCVCLLSFATPAFGFATDFATPVPDAGSSLWLVGAATAGLAGLRLYFGKRP